MSHSVNFIEQTEPEPVRESRVRRRWGLKVVVVLLVLASIYIVTALVFAGRVLANALDGKEAVEQAAAAVYQLDFETARDLLSEAEGDFSEASSGLKIFSIFKPLPWVGEQYEAVAGILSASASTAATLNDLLEVAEDVVRLAVGTESLVEGVSAGEDISWAELPAESKRAIIMRLGEAASDLELAKVEIDLILKDLVDLPTDSLIAPLKLVLNPFVDQLTALDKTLDALIPVAFVLPTFAGLEEEQHVLLLFLNNSEMRPGGGFIGSYGIVSLKDGEMVNLETHDVMDVDGPVTGSHQVTPPEPIRDYLNLDTWYFRDSNWSPDFAVSTQKGLELFGAETAGAPAGTVLKQPYVEFDAVIGITPTFVSDILAIVGPIELDNQTFSATNILTTLEYAVEYGFAEDGIPFDQRKEIIGDLADVVKERLFDLPAERWQEVFSAVSQALGEKQFVIYTTDETIESVVSRKNWAGRVFPGRVDTLMVVDANLAALKTDTAVSRNISYSIEPTTGGSYQGQVQITYRHNGTFDWKTTRYRTYTRIYVPEGSELIDYSGTLADDQLRNPSLAPGEADVVDELGLTSFGAFTAVEPGEVGVLTFRYQLPESVVESIEQGVYELDVIKQIGAADHELSLDLDFDKSVSGAYPGEESNYHGDDSYSLNTYLDQNLKFVVEF